MYFRTFITVKIDIIFFISDPVYYFADPYVPSVSIILRANAETIGMYLHVSYWHHVLFVLRLL